MFKTVILLVLVHFYRSIAYSYPVVFSIDLGALWEWWDLAGYDKIRTQSFPPHAHSRQAPPTPSITPPSISLDDTGTTGYESGSIGLLYRKIQIPTIKSENTNSKICEIPKFKNSNISKIPKSTENLKNSIIQTKPKNAKLKHTKNPTIQIYKNFKNNEFWILIKKYKNCDFRTFGLL